MAIRKFSECNLTGGKKRFISGSFWNPSKLNGSLVLWLDAADASTITLNGTNVSQWDDKSGNGYHFTQTTAAEQPLYDTVNNAVDFDGTQLLLRNDILGFSANPEVTMISVFKPRAITATTRYQQLGDGSASTGWSFYSAGTPAYWNTAYNNDLNRFEEVDTNDNDSVLLMSAEKPASSSYSDDTFYLNGTQQTQSVSGTGTPNLQNSTRIGGGIFSSNTVTYRADVVYYEAIYLNVKDTTTRQKVEGYLAHKWNIANRLPVDHPYKYSAPQQ